MPLPWGLFLGFWGVKPIQLATYLPHTPILWGDLVQENNNQQGWNLLSRGL